MVIPRLVEGCPTMVCCSLLASTMRTTPSTVSNFFTTASVGGFPDSADFMTLIVSAIR